MEGMFTLEFLEKRKDKEINWRTYFEFIFSDEFTAFLFAFGTFFLLFFKNAINDELWVKSKVVLGKKVRLFEMIQGLKTWEALSTVLEGLASLDSEDKDGSWDKKGGNTWDWFWGLWGPFSRGGSRLKLFSIGDKVKLRREGGYE